VRVAIVFSIAGLAVGLAAAPAAADSFEAHADAATRVRDPADLVWALTATCDRGDDVQQRQCRIVRDRKLASLAGATLLVQGDPDALVLGPWSAAKKSVPMTVTACVRCRGIEFDGKTWYLTGRSPRIDRSGLTGPILYDNARTIADEASAAAWKASISTARFELVVKVADPPRFQLGGKNGIALDILAWRVTNACDGKVVVSSLPSGPGLADKKACGTGPATTGPAPVDTGGGADDPPSSLTPSMVREGMRPVVAAARACSSRMKISGRAKLTLVISGDGTVASHEQTGDFVNTPLGRCIDQAVGKATFPRTRRAITKIGYPLVLQ